MKAFIFFVSILPLTLLSQKIDHLSSFKDMGTNHYFRFNYENDFFAASDKNYTQGYSFEFAHSSLNKNPINKLFVKTNSNINIYGIALEHIGFTPSDFVSPEVQLGDRPFAAGIYLKSFYIAVNSSKKIRFSQSISLGLIGPGAFGKEMQTKIHEITGNKIPGGWDNQIQNDLILNYEISFEKQVFQFKNIANLQAASSLQLGTLFTNASLGFNTSIGILDNTFSDHRNPRKLKIYAFTKPQIHIIGYDATLQGGIFTNDNPYTISSKNIERFTAQIDYGLILKYKKMYLEYSRSSITKEFTTGDAANWGGFKIGFLFK